MFVTRAARWLAATCFVAAVSLAAPALAQTEQPPPKSGGSLEIATVYYTLSALSWDLADWNWKQNHDAGQIYEQLFAADLTKARRQASILCRSLDSVGCDAWRTRRELEMAGPVAP